MKKYLLGLIAIVLTINCSPLPEIENVDLKKWQQDKHGCESYRIEVIDQILAQKGKLRGLSQNEIIELFGQADQHELYERSQKFFIYHLEPGNACENFNGQYFKAFYIRFNSLDQAIDFIIQEIK
jgi:hypothetical protein